VGANQDPSKSIELPYIQWHVVATEQNVVLLFSKSRGTGEVSLVWVVPRLGSAGGMVVHPVTGGEINNMG
jgi:hypothetical protein